MRERPVRRHAEWRPSTGTPACSQACRSTCSWRGEPTRLRITPAMPDRRGRTSRSRAAARRRCGSGRGRRPPGPPARPAARRRARWIPRRARRPCVIDPAVEQPHDALDDGDVGARAAVPVQRTDQLLADQHRVEVAAGPARGQRVVAGIDEVRADLERRDPVSGPPQRAHQTRCHRGLSAARRRRGDDHGGRAHAALPRALQARGIATLADSAVPVACSLCRRGANVVQSVSRADTHARGRRPLLTTRCPSGPCGRRPSGA